MNEEAVQGVDSMTITQVVEMARDTIANESRFDALVAIRDEAARLVNAERDNEKKRVAADRDRLKAQLKEQQDRLRAVSTITKPRGKRDNNPNNNHSGGAKNPGEIATQSGSGKTDTPIGARNEREIPPSATPGSTVSSEQ